LNHCAWFLTWLDARGKSATRNEILDTLEIYLSGLRGSGTVERIFKEVSMLELKQRCHKLGHPVLESSLKLIFQDERGRRRETLDPVALLCDGPGLVAGGGAVHQRGSKYFIKCQRMYADWYGTRLLKARSLTADPPELSRAKPKLGRVVPRNASSEGARLRKHKEGCEKALSALAGGDSNFVLPVGVGSPMGVVASSAPGSASASASSSSGGASASASTEPDSKKRPAPHAAVEAIVAKQQKITDLKRAVHGSAVPGRPVPYVDAKGGVYRPHGIAPGTVRALSTQASVRLGHGLKMPDNPGRFLVAGPLNMFPDVVVATSATRLNQRMMLLCFV
jgi:hypothetical protein